MSNDNWYDEALKEFMFDLAAFSGVTQEDVQKVYSYLFNEGLVDYDVEKEYLYDNYVEDEDKDEDE